MTCLLVSRADTSPRLEIPDGQALELQVATDNPSSPFRSPEDEERFYSELGGLRSDQEPDLICGVAYTDWAYVYDTRQNPRICWLPPHTAETAHNGPPAMPYVIIEAARRNQIDSSPRQGETSQ